MNRLESIKERVTRLQEIKHDPTESNQEMLSKMYEIKDIKIKQIEDIEYLLQRLERYEKAFSDIRNVPVHPLQSGIRINLIIEEALKEER